MTVMRQREMGGDLGRGTTVFAVVALLVVLKPLTSNAQTPPQVITAPTATTPTQPPAQGGQAQALSQPQTIKSAPINVIALPPEEEFEDEFKLPPDASPALIARRNLIDHTVAKINEIDDKLDQLMQSQNFDSPPQEVVRLRAIQDAYRDELKALRVAHEAFREQRVKDVESRYSDMPPAQLSPEEMKEVE